MKTPRLLAWLLAAAFAAGCHAQPADASAPGAPLTAAQAFIDMPLKVIDLLEKETRERMVTLKEQSDSVWAAPNTLGGVSRLVRLDPTFAEVELSPVSKMQLKVLRDNPQAPLVVMSYTITSDPGQRAGDSTLLFFEGERQLSEKEARKLFRIPQVKDFFEIPKGSATKMKELEEMVPFPTVIYSLEPDSYDMTATLTVGEYMPVEDYNLVKLFLRGPLTYVWNGKAFKPAGK